MDSAQLIHELKHDFDGSEYLIEVFVRPDGSHFARTTFSPEDVIISDGVNLDDVILKHRELLPLAVRSRKMHFSSRMIN